MRNFLFKSLFFLAAAGLGLANKLPNVTAPALPDNLPNPDPIQLISALSPQCQGAFLSIIANPEFFECVPVGALLPVLTDPTFLPSVLKDPLGSGPKLLPIVEAICAVPKCSDDGVAGALKAIEEGCSSGSDKKNPIVQLAVGVITFYSPVRDIICFKNNKDEFCVADTISTILTLPKPPFRLLDGGFIDSLIFSEPKFICTPCNKAITNTVINFFNSTPSALDILDEAFHIGEEELFIAKIGLAAKCGFQFEDGKVNDPTIDPKKFTYQVAGNKTNTDDDDYKKNDASSMKEISLLMAGSILASTYLVV